MKARKIRVAALKPGMVTTDWIVLSAPRQVGVELAVDMRHRVDGGASTIYYDLTAETTVIELASAGPVLFGEYDTLDEYVAAQHEITVNRADFGDRRVVLSPASGGPGAVALTPANARRFAKAVLDAADTIEGIEDKAVIARTHGTQVQQLVAVRL